MLIYSEMATPVEKVDLEPAVGLEEATGQIKYHVWERTLNPMPTLFSATTTRFFREYRGLVAARDLVWLLFPERS